MNTVFYKKVGRRYQPVSEYDSELCDAFPQGAHLVVTKPGSRSIQYRIDPNYAAMIAAGRYAQDAMADSIREATELRPHNHEMSEAEQAKWKQFIRTMPDEFRFMMTHGSAMDAVFAGIKAMEQEADKMLSNPAVRKAYDNFMLMCKLTKEEEL
jgi:hypothetical protein